MYCLRDSASHAREDPVQQWPAAVRWQRMTDSDSRTITGTGVPVRGSGIDTDQILTPGYDDAEGTARHLFADVNGDGPDASHLHEADFQGASILLVNADFGVGDARKAVARALADRGIEVIVGESFGPDFVVDCTSVGIETVTAGQDAVETLQEWAIENPGGKIKVDVADELLVYGVRNHHERDGDTYEPGFAAEEFVPVTVAD